MNWKAALRWAVPAWLLIGAGTVAINYATEAKASIFNLVLALVAAYPLITFIIKMTGEDLAKWRASLASRDDEIERP